MHKHVCVYVRVYVFMCACVCLCVCVFTGHLEAAYQRGEQLLQSFPEDFLLNLELGVIQVV